MLNLASSIKIFLTFFNILLQWQSFFGHHSPVHTHTYTYNDMRGAPPVNSTDIDRHKKLRNSAFLDREKEGERETQCLLRPLGAS